MDDQRIKECVYESRRIKENFLAGQYKKLQAVKNSCCCKKSKLEEKNLPSNNNWIKIDSVNDRFQ